MAVKGEKMDPELAARMKAGRAAAMARRKAAQEARRARAMAVPIVNDLDAEDVSMPAAPAAIEEQEFVPAPVGDPADPYNQWLALLDADTRMMFSNRELRATFDEQKVKVDQEKRTRKRKEITELALSTARSMMGLLPEQKVEALRVSQQNAKPVSMVIKMPPAQDNGLPADIGLRVDGKVLLDGRRHYCTYGEAASLREMLYRHGQHELLFKGQNLRYRAYLLGQAMGSVNTQIEANERGVSR
jgi:hypothetical protein